jgi:hypothetical protein
LPRTAKRADLAILKRGVTDEMSVKEITALLDVIDKIDPNIVPDAIAEAGYSESQLREIVASLPTFH